MGIVISDDHRNLIGRTWLPSVRGQQGLVVTMTFTGGLGAVRVGVPRLDVIAIGRSALLAARAFIPPGGL